MPALPDITEKEADILWKWITGWYMEDRRPVVGKDLKQLMEAFGSVAEKTKNRPLRVYRGLRLDKGYISKILANKPFRLSTKKIPFVSWTKEHRIATSISVDKFSTSNLGIVVETVLKPNEIIIDLTNAMVKRIEDVSKRITHYRQKEVIAKYNKNRQYKFCDNVTNLLVIYRSGEDNKDVSRLLGKLPERYRDDMRNGQAFNFECDKGEITFKGEAIEHGYVEGKLK